MKKKTVRGRRIISKKDGLVQLSISSYLKKTLALEEPQRPKNFRSNELLGENFVSLTERKRKLSGNSEGGRDGGEKTKKTLKMDI